VVLQSERDYNKEEANIFFTIARKVGELMVEIISSVQGAVFSYVDCIFCNTESKVAVEQIIKAAGFESKSEPVFIEQFGGNFKVQEIKEGGELGREKSYFISPLKTPEFYLQTVQDESWANEIIEKTKEIEGYTKEQKRKILSKALRLSYNLSSKFDLNWTFLAKELAKNDILIEDIFKLKLKIEKSEKDSFGDEIIFIIDKVISIKEFEQEKLKMFDTGEKDILGVEKDISYSYEINFE